MTCSWDNEKDAALLRGMTGMLDVAIEAVEGAAEKVKAASDGECVPLVSEPKWPRPIPVSERLPELNHGFEYGDPRSDFVMAFDGGYGIWDVGQLASNGRWVCGDDENETPVTHWLPLPPAPEDEE